MENLFVLEINQTLETIQKILSDKELLNSLQRVSELCLKALNNGHKIIFAGNGGSAADSQHLAAELVSRLNFDRPALPAISLTVDTSVLTAIGNDYGYQFVFARQLEAIGNRGDIFFAISTSGNSQNILEAIKIAKEKEIIVVGMTGLSAGKMREHCDYLLNIPAQRTPKIQECHIILGHIICDYIEQSMFMHLRQKIG